MIRRLKLKVFVVTGALLSVLLPGYAFADKRVALVVGNSQYQKVARLPNPANDAADVAAALKGMDFKVIEIEEADRSVFFSALKEFQRSAIGADVVVFFYAGHGIQVKGMNYFVPVEADVADQTNVDYDLVSIADVGKALDVAPKGIRIMILDTCRDNPLARGLNTDSGSGWVNTISRGIILQNPPVSGAAPPVLPPPVILPPVTVPLTNTDPPRGSGGKIVVYATQSNQVAQDGSERNSPFTSALLKRLSEPGVEVGMLFRRVTNDVMEKTNGKQVPELSISLGTEYILNQSPTDAAVWGDVLRSNDPEAFRQFIARFPNSSRVPDAEHWIATLERNKAAVLAQIETERRASEADRLARIEADRKAAEEIARATAAAQEHAKRLAREDAERKAAAETARLKAEQDHIAKLEAEKAARDEAVRVATERHKADEARIAADKEAARLVKAEADRLAKVESDRAAAADKEAARLARLETERKQKLDAERAAAAVEKDRQEKLAAAETAKKEREESLRLARVQEADRLAAADRERLARAQAETAKREAEKLAAKADTERLAKIEAERQAALEREKTEALSREQAARELARREEAARLAQFAEDQRKFAEVERQVAFQRERLAKLAQERADHDEALRVAAADEASKRQADAKRAADAEAAKSADKVAQDDAALADARRLQAARIAALEQEQKNAALALDAASKAEAERLAVLAAEMRAADAAAAAADSGAPAGGTQVALLDSVTRTMDKHAVVTLTAPPAEIGGSAAGPTPEAANAVFDFFVALAGSVKNPLQSATDKVATIDTSIQPILPRPIDREYNTPDLLKSAQAELKRVGCYEGRESGNLNIGTRAALDLYGRANGYASFRADGEIKITAGFVEAIRLETGIVCKPVKKTIEANIPKSNDDGGEPVRVKPRHEPNPVHVRPQPVEPQAPIVRQRPAKPQQAAPAQTPRPTRVVQRPVTVPPVIAPRGPAKGLDVNISGF